MAPDWLTLDVPTFGIPGLSRDLKLSSCSCCFGSVNPFYICFGSIDPFLRLLWFCRSISMFALVLSIHFSVCLSFFCVISFLQFWVQGGHLFKPIYWPFVGGCVGTVFLTFTQILVSYSSCLPRLLWREVLCNYPAVEGMGYQEVKGVCAGMAVLNPEYQDAHNQENQSYIGISYGFGLTYQSEIRKFQGYCYLWVLGRGSNLLLPTWFAFKA